ncbi:MAG: N-acetylneuraminate synthase family protein [Planctomycetota bacterium]|nr:N-acetylneuraminate synthase family protein [Planctomycetota bacterium]
MSVLMIGARRVGPGEEPYVIAEIGVNHDGSAERAVELVEIAARAGVDAVKFQLFRASMLMSRAAVLAAYQKRAGESDPVEMLRRLELSAEQLAPAVFRAHQHGLHAIVSVFSVGLVKEAHRLSWDAYKTASPDIINKPLLDALAQTGKPLIVSTGTATLEEVARAGVWMRGTSAAFLQCVSSYPAEDRHAAVGAVRAVEGATDRVVGYSDHTPRVETALVAVGAGASILEKHLTYDRGAAGPDHAASLDGAQMAEYVRLARLGHALMGDGVKRVLDAEKDVRQVSRQSLTATRRIPRGKAIEPADLTIKRPGTGIEPWRMDDVVGRVAARDVDADMPLMEEDVK